jgi:hypothetical protein
LKRDNVKPKKQEYKIHQNRFITEEEPMEDSVVQEAST